MGNGAGIGLPGSWACVARPARANGCASCGRTTSTVMASVRLAAWSTASSSSWHSDGLNCLASGSLCAPNPALARMQGLSSLVMSESEAMMRAASSLLAREGIQNGALCPLGKGDDSVAFAAGGVVVRVRSTTPDHKRLIAAWRAAIELSVREPSLVVAPLELSDGSLLAELSGFTLSLWPLPQANAAQAGQRVFGGTPRRCIRPPGPAARCRRAAGRPG